MSNEASCGKTIFYLFIGSIALIFFVETIVWSIERVLGFLSGLF